MNKVTNLEVTRTPGEDDRFVNEVDLIDSVYRAFLNELNLSETHRTDLRNRNFSNEAIRDGGYKTISKDSRARGLEYVTAQFNDTALKVVPGFVCDNDGWKFVSADGLVVPTRDDVQKITSLKIRSDSGKRYSYASAKKYGGAGPKLDIHVPVHACDVGSIPRLTEGELKADAATLMSGRQTFGIAGIGNYRKAIAEMKRMDVREIQLAPDMDAFTNPNVARQVANCHRDMIASGIRTSVATWDASIKGLDDALKAGAPIVEHFDNEAVNVIEAMLKKSGASELDPLVPIRIADKSEQAELLAATPTTVGEHASVPLGPLASKCDVIRKLKSMIDGNSNLGHIERFRLAQIAIGASLDDGEIEMLFVNQKNFDKRTTLSQIQSIRSEFRLPACSRLSADLGFCDGACPSKQAANVWSPIQLMDRISISDRPIIQKNKTQLIDIVNEAWAAFHKANEPIASIFNQRGQLVRTVDRSDALKIEPLDRIAMYGHLARVAHWVVESKGEVTDSKPDTHVASDMLAYVDDRVPPLEMVATTPIFNEAGDLLEEPGYHRVSALILDEKRLLRVPHVPSSPSREEVSAAVSKIRDEAFGDFPFVAESDRAHAIGMLLLFFARQMVDGCTPLHGFEAPTPGTGKSLLIKLIVFIATGRAADLHTLPSAEEEMRKKITSELMTAPRSFIFDNAPADRVIDSPNLAAALTASNWSDRKLGVNQTLNLPNNAIYGITGNNMRFSTELSRRYARIRLDAKVDRPWVRSQTSFRHPDVLGWAKENRSELVHACLVCIRAWLAAGRPKPNLIPLGSFESYSIVIGGILEVIGVPGFLADGDDIFEAADVEGQAWREFVEVWQNLYHGAAMSPGELIKICDAHDLMNTIRGDGPLKSQQTAFGKALVNARDRVFGSYRLKLNSDKGSHGKRYSLEPTEPQSSHQFDLENPL